MTIFGQTVRSDDRNVTGQLIVEMIMNTALMWPPDDNLVIVLPCGMGDLVFGLLVIKSFDSIAVETFSKLWQGMIGTLQQLEISSIGIGGEETVQETGFIFNSLRPPMNKKRVDAGLISRCVTQ